MISPGTLVRAVRAPSLTAGAMPVLTANALGVHQGHGFDGAVFGLTLLGMVAVQAGVNLINDYFDDKSGLDADPDFADSPFPLGSRVIQQGRLSPRGVLIYALVCFALATACGLALDRRHDGHVILGIAVAGGLLGYFYTAPPLQIAYRGAGEPVTFLLFGPLAGLGAYYAQVGSFDRAAGLVATIVGVMAMAILFLHHFPQHDADARHGKKTPIVRLGPVAAGRCVPPLLSVPYVLVVAGMVTGLLPWTAVVFALTLPLAVRVARTALGSPDHPRRMAGAVGGGLGMHFFGGLLLSGALVLA